MYHRKTWVNVNPIVEFAYLEKIEVVKQENEQRANTIL
jgi:hypothetical protein